MLPERRYAEWRTLRGGGLHPRWFAIPAGLLAFILCIALFPRSTVLWMGAGLIVGRLTWIFALERRLRGLRDDAQIGQFATALTLSRECAYAYDEGLISFVDGWLVFSGRRCVFSVRSVDVEVQASRTGATLLYSGPGGQHRAVLNLTGEKGLTELFTDWQSQSSVPGTPVLPPVLSTRKTHFRIVIAASLCGLVLLALMSAPAWAICLATLLVLPLTLYIWKVDRALKAINAGHPSRPFFWNRSLGKSPPLTLPKGKP